MFDLYHFGDGGTYDQNNPFYCFDQGQKKAICYHIGKLPLGQADLSTLSDRVGLNQEDLRTQLTDLESFDFVRQVEGYYVLNFCLLYEEDLDPLTVFIGHLSRNLYDRLAGKKAHIHDLVGRFQAASSFSPEEILYHILGSYIFDGLALDHLAKEGLIRVSKAQRDNRDYMLFGFETSEKMESYSNKLLCSCNTYRTEDVDFTSFGDGAGSRNDFYRFYRQVDASIMKGPGLMTTKTAYNNLLGDMRQKTGQACGRLILKLLRNPQSTCKEDTLVVDFLKALNYLDGQGQIQVPVFYPEDQDFIKELHDLVMGEVTPIFRECLETMADALPITPFKHGLDKEEVFNEVWHQIFGNINEICLQEGFFAQPFESDLEGRYLKAIFVKKEVGDERGQ